jgi:hypothetical protein
VTTVGKIEAAPKIDGRNMIMVLAPDRHKKKTTSGPDEAAAPSPGGTA